MGEIDIVGDGWEGSLLIQKEWEEFQGYHGDFIAYLVAKYPDKFKRTNTVCMVLGAPPSIYRYTDSPGEEK
jgi:hypothetical protein